MIDLSKYRKDFPMLHTKMHGCPLVYLDSAATAQKPQQVINAIVDYYQSHYGTVHRAIYQIAIQATEKYEDSRKAIQSLLNASSPDEIIFTRGTTDAINLVAASFGKYFLHEGDEVILSEIEHHSNIVPWQMICRERKASIKVIPVNEKGELRLEEYKKLLSKKTKMVALCHIANSTGTVNPVKQIIVEAHKHGAKVLIDGAQSVPHMKVDVSDLDVDFYAFSGHKCFGPTGIGVLYGKKELLEELPPYQGGSDMIDVVTFEKTTYAKPPLKFEAGTPITSGVIGLGAAVKYLEDVGLDNICEWEKHLLAEATSLVRSIPGLRIIGEATSKASILSFVVEGAHTLDIGSLLDLKGIAIRTGHLCAQPSIRHFHVDTLCRASFAFYNTIDEIRYFAKSLAEVISFLRK